MTNDNEFYLHLYVIAIWFLISPKLVYTFLHFWGYWLWRYWVYFLHLLKISLLFKHVFLMHYFFDWFAYLAIVICLRGFFMTVDSKNNLTLIFEDKLLLLSIELYSMNKNIVINMMYCLWIIILSLFL